MHRIRIGTILTMGFVSLLLAGFLGCGEDGNGSGDNSPGVLASDLQALDTRLQSHVDSVDRILVSVAGAAAYSPAALSGTDWGAIQAERDRYAQDMRSILGDMGQNVGSIGDCRITCGGTTYGSPGSASCSSQPDMDRTFQELDHHLQEMSWWMNQHDPSGLLQEMGRHRDQMRADILDMGSRMDQLYGGHDGWMNGWDDYMRGHGMM